MCVCVYTRACHCTGSCVPLSGWVLIVALFYSVWDYVVVFVDIVGVIVMILFVGYIYESMVSSSDELDH